MTWLRSELTYCTNVHAAESVDALFKVIQRQLGEIRLRRKQERFSSGLWICQPVAKVLATDKEQKKQFCALLNEHKIDLFTLNGFPYGNFHAEKVKQDVYLPDWSEPERFEYSTQLAQILAGSLPAHIHTGTISTLPLGYRCIWDEDKNDAASIALCRLAMFLEQLFRQTGKKIRMCLEMEPDCVLETTKQMIDFFQRDLAKASADLQMDKRLINEYLGVCFDVCHQAVMFEEVDDSLQCFLKAGIQVGKIQISSALEISPANPQQLRQALLPFVEKKYLHQVRCECDGDVTAFADLPDLLNMDSFNAAGKYRVHFHLPVQLASINQKNVRSTQSDILKVLDFLEKHPDFKPHLEVETYTWHVLPDFFQAQSEEVIKNGLIGELDWLEEQLLRRHLIS